MYFLIKLVTWYELNYGEFTVGFQKLKMYIPFLKYNNTYLKNEKKL